MNKKLSKFLLDRNNPYILKIDEMIVEVEYSNNNKTFKECIINILKNNNSNVW